MLTNSQLAERRRNSIRRRSQLSHGLTFWLCLLVAGILVMVFAAITLLSTSAAKIDAAQTEGNTFRQRWPPHPEHRQWDQPPRIQSLTGEIPIAPRPLKQEKRQVRIPSGRLPTVLQRGRQNGVPVIR